MSLSMDAMTIAGVDIACVWRGEFIHECVCFQQVYFIFLKKMFMWVYKIPVIF